MSLTKLITSLYLLIISISVFSQTRTVTGKITSNVDSFPLVGASVHIKGTTIGTTADFDGNFTINVNSINDTLVFSFVGMQQQELRVGSTTVFNIALSENTYRVDEVVVTALGISRQSKSLGYSVEKIDADDIVKGNDRSFLNSLQGKVAGVTISSSSGAPGSSSRILIRGVSSLGRSNQPLFIVDGVPVSNASAGSTSINGGTDFGNRANDINPDDIESMTVLKGSAGTALYGSSAANGVIIITTKKGNYKNTPEIILSSNMTLEEPLRLVKYQNEFGQGTNGEFVRYENMSWGPSFDKEIRLWGNQVDSAYRVKPYAAMPYNVKEFFDIGKQYNNSVSVSGGGESVTYFLSYSNIKADGIFPTNADRYDRNTIALRSEQKLSNKLKSSISVNYINKFNSYVPTGQGEQSVYNQIMQTPRDISLIELSDINNKFNTVDNFYSLYTINPYFILNNNKATYDEDRVFGNINIEYELIKGLNLQARLGDDFSYGKSKSTKSLIIPEGNNEFAAIYEPGQIVEGTSFSQVKNFDFLLSYHRELSNKLGIQFVAGNNIYESMGKSLIAEANGFSVEGHDHLSNSNEPPNVYEFSSLKRLVGAYANFDISYESMIYLTLTARNDWSSTLAKGNNSFFYPGANIGFVFTELFPSIQKVLSYGKVRAGYAHTGNDAPVYRLTNAYSKGIVSDGYGVFQFPISGVNGYELDNLLGNKDLRPELTSEFEVGTDLRFLRNRVGIDFAYYNSIVTNLIWDAQISAASGFTRKTTNLGKMENNGIEILLNLTPVKLKKLTWDISFNYSQNKNILVSLNESTEKVILTGIGVSGGQQINYVAKPGRTVGIFEARTILRDNQGRIVVDNQGVPRADEDLVEYGNGNYDYVGGVNSVITYAGLSLSAALDIRQGGIMYSRTKDISAWAGTTPETLYNNRQPFIVPNSVYEVSKDNNGNPIYAENNKPLDSEHLLEFWGNGGYLSDGFALIDKSYIKLREVTCSYTIPSKILNKLPVKGITVNVVGKNLYLWTPEDQYYIDPEVTTFGNDLTSNFGEYSATPSIRSISFGLRITL